MACYSNAELAEIEAAAYRARISTNENQLKFQGCLITSLRAEIGDLKASLAHMGGHLEIELEEADKLRAEIAKLRAALEPFAKAGKSKSAQHNDFHGALTGLSLTDLRVAAISLEQIIVK